MAKPRKGKAKVKVTASGKKVSYGQAGAAKGPELSPQAPPGRAGYRHQDYIHAAPKDD